MKIFILSVIILSSCFCKAQDANADIDKRIDAKLNPAILSSGTTIAQAIKTAIAALGPFESDTVITATKNSNTAFNIDTLYIGINTQVTFYIDMSCDNTANMQTGGAGKKVRVQNANGVYSLRLMGDYPVYAGDATIAKAGWNIIQSGNFVIIQCLPVSGINMNWIVEVKANYPQNLK